MVEGSVVECGVLTASAQTWDAGVPGPRVPGAVAGERCCAGSQLDPVSSTTARDGADAARPLRSAGGTPPEITGLLEQVQIDHTPST
jgi:putative transposase